MTIEEMDAEIAHMDAHLKRLHDEAVAECTSLIARTRDPVLRELYHRELERVREISNGRYD
jgi:hypothetical protein